jgi:hypothetical protein
MSMPFDACFGYVHGLTLVRLDYVFVLSIWLCFWHYFVN